MGNNFVDEGGVCGAVAKITARVTVKPILPRELLVLVEFVDEVHEERSVLSLEISHPKAANLHRKTNLLPSD